ncbi:hypothetical protein ASO20_02560 [Mycoplasma sp. (ex Biomphalaria glabrata)]|uniref:aldo/keto reductase family protein n=1 Tax=Mycoplasma sp. (ex Biomphalaria glabrata) TaxID=1749074 RepID=UPI00073ADF05|nr:aldo/keto reductase [Mycoplasma sp. (ex Biomphalaria glabrata)]ALV23517.1 hypothetical protein ASO20_02560 [Mycoplasma sp. (ex Biomphalaria glabrata)]
MSVLKDRIIFGTYELTNQEKITECIFAAGKTGYNVIDTAWVYKNEKEVGEAVRKYNSSNKHQLLIQTKLWPSHFLNAREQILSQLKVMGIDKIHSVLLHRIPINLEDALFAWKELIKLKNEKIIEHIGVSNFDHDDVEYLIYNTGVCPEINQIELSILNYRHDRVLYNQKRNIVIQAWSPLGKDLIPLNLPSVKKIASLHKCTTAQIAIAYLLEQNNAVVVKSEHLERIQQNIDALKIKLSSEEIEVLQKENKYENKYSDRLDSTHYRGKH